AADLFEEAIDEYLLCDEMGLNVCATEHHAGINSLLGANPMLVGILARQTRKARILSLGTLVSLRREPVRVAEEYATADVISRGRLELGFVKSGGTEMASANVSPVNNIERYWEAIDLIAKALAHQDRPFSSHANDFHAPPAQRVAASLAIRIQDVGGAGRSAPRRRSRPSRHGAHAGAARRRRHATGLCRLPSRARSGGPAAGLERQFRLHRLRVRR